METTISLERLATPENTPVVCCSSGAACTGLGYYATKDIGGRVGNVEDKGDEGGRRGGKRARRGPRVRSLKNCGYGKLKEKAN
jgi:hypothetical protein